MQKKKENKYFLLLYYIFAIFMILAVIITLNTSSTSINRNHDIQIKASTKVEQAMEILKAREAEVSEYYDYGDFYESYEDKVKYYDSVNLNTGMLGAEYTAITTTIGNLDSKITSLDPNFAAVYIKMFDKLSLKPGDEAVINISGSFPMLDISCIVAMEEYGLKPFIMASIGASSYGATNPAFTIFDMLEYLYDQKIINSRIDVVSLGGSNDIGSNFGEFNNYRDRDLIIERINKSGIAFLYEKNFDKNIELRLSLIESKCKNVKLFVNVGGNSVGLGINENAYYKSNGILYARNYRKTNFSNHGAGLIEQFLMKDINAIQVLNLKYIALEYGLEYGFNKLPEVGSGGAYVEVKYNLTYSIISIIALIAFLLYFKKKKISKEI